MEHLNSTTDGSTIHCISLGRGPAIIFLHGWTSSAREWLAYASVLADDYRVLCWDARGHGGHESPIKSTHVHDMARDLHQLINHHQLHDVVLVGHSMGAITAWEYIRQFGCELLSGLCILDQSPCLVTKEGWPLGIYGDFDAQRNAQFIKDLRNDFAESMLRLVAYGRNEKSRKSYEANTIEIQKIRKYQARQSAIPLIECWRSLTSQDYRDVLTKISIPTLLIYGAQSQFYGVETAQYVSQAIPDNSLHIYENADHSPHEETEQFLEDLTAFFYKKYNLATSNDDQTSC